MAGLGGLETIISAGFIDIFGSPIFLGLIGLFTVVAIGLSFRLGTDLMIMGIVVMVTILSQAFLPPWFFYLMIIVLALFVLGIALNKIFARG